MNENTETRVTVRVKKELHNNFKSVMSLIGSNITDNIILHIKEQTNKYKLYESDLEFSNMEYKKINIIIDSELYKQYKIKMIKNNTTPTADIIRYMQFIVEKSATLINQKGAVTTR